MSRLIRTLTAACVVTCAYFAYALVAVPLIEPEVVHPGGSARATTPPRPPGARWLPVLAQHFAPGAWQLEGPKVLQSERAWFLFRDYRNLPDGRVELSPFCLLIFTKPKSDAPADRPAQAIVMEALQGAVLKFDEPLDLRLAKIGKLVGGQLVGPITIHSSPAGTGDDLAIATRDVKLTDNRLFTEHAVDFRLGRNRGSGRQMQIVLATGEKAVDGPVERTISGLDSFELARDVKMRLELAGRGLLPADGRPGRASDADPPIEITCQGAFRFDLPGLVATFNDQVDVVRLNDAGESDQLNCERLSVLFRRRDANGPPRAPGGKEPSAAAPDIEPRAIEARGEPVVVRAPSSLGHARCQRLEYEVDSGRITLEGGEEVLLHQGTNEIRSRRLDYQPDRDGGLGRLSAAGPGWLQGAVAADPAQKYQAQWSEELRLRPFEQFQIVSLIGAASVRYSTMGKLSADEIHVWLADAPLPAQPTAQRRRLSVRTVAYRQSAGDAGVEPGAAGLPAEARATNRGPAAGSAAPWSGLKTRPVEPDRMLAQGQVRIDSPRLSGAVGRLEVRFARSGAASGGNGSAERVEPLPPDVVPFSSLGKPGGAAAPAQYRVEGDTLKIGLTGSATQPQPTDISVEGRATLSEKPSQHDQQPLIIKGDSIAVARADEPEATAGVVGKPAYIEARGLTLVGPKIELERSANRLSVAGAGRMTLPGDGALTGQAVGNLEIVWQRGMQFDGRTATFERSVVARGQQQTLHAEWLAVSLDRRIDFAQPTTAKHARPVVEAVECRGELTLENRSFDERGLVSIDVLQSRDATINRASGAIQAGGPGWVRSVRRGKPARPGRGARPVEASDEDGLSFLLVTFERGIEGDLNRREITFADGVRAVYGPVADWEDRLPLDDPDALGEEGLLLSADQLTVRQSPTAASARARAPLEVETLGNTVAEGDAFTARAHRMTYSEGKDQLVLQGTSTLDAELFRQQKAGGPVSRLLAREIRFWPGANKVEFDGLRTVDSGDLPAGGARLPRPGRK